MKKISEMTDKEIREKIDLLSAIDSKETAGLLCELKEELSNRETQQKLKEQAKKQEEEKLVAAEIEKEKALRKKQHDVLGKCFKQVDVQYKLPRIYFYKVIGVIGEYAITRMVSTEKSTYVKMLSTSPYTFIKIDKLLDLGTPISDEEYRAQEKESDTEFNQYFDSEIFENIEKRFTKIFNSFPWF